MQLPPCISKKGFTFVPLALLAIFSGPTSCSPLDRTHVLGMLTTDWERFKREKLATTESDLARAIEAAGHKTLAVLPCLGEDSFSGPYDSTFYGGQSRESFFSTYQTEAKNYREKWNSRILLQLSAFHVVTRTRSELQELLHEIDLGAAGFLNSETAIKAGRLMGASAIVMPQLDLVVNMGREGTGAFIAAHATYKVRAIEVETGRVLFDRVVDDLSYRKRRNARSYIGQEYDF